MRLTKAETARLYELIAQGLRPCRQCGRVLSLSAFHEAKKEIGGVVSRCKECVRINRSGQRAERAAKQRAYYQRTLAKRRAYEASRRESRKAYNKAWREAHIVEINGRMKQWRIAHKAEMRATQRRYLQTPEGKEKNRRAAHIRAARLRAVLHTLSPKAWQDALEWFGHRCVYCGTEDVPLEQEHVVPLVKGGGYVAGNIVPACASCNSSKRTQGLEDWIAGRGAAFVQAGAIERVRAYRLGLLGEA